ncbi:hypothetical protein, partial [Klebsiella pneumoniae]|uniref:hypothetical protein n=1 Tax=Klebsiella pneumoniae TaxID=573 RepID=UPI00405575D6
GNPQQENSTPHGFVGHIRDDGSSNCPHQADTVKTEAIMGTAAVLVDGYRGTHSARVLLDSGG